MSGTQETQPKPLLTPETAPEYYRGVAATLEYKDKKDLTFGERHAVRHMRHARDKEYSRLAFQLCNEFSGTYATCCAQNSFSAAWTCRRPLQELKACINRHIIAFNQAESELQTLPATPKDFSDYSDIVQRFEAQQRDLKVSDQYRIEQDALKSQPPSF
eukprot:UN01292